jgi:hypothetical protein
MAAQNTPAGTQDSVVVRMARPLPQVQEVRDAQEFMVVKLWHSAVVQMGSHLQTGLTWRGVKMLWRHLWTVAGLNSAAVLIMLLLHKVQMVMAVWNHLERLVKTPNMGAVRMGSLRLKVTTRKVAMRSCPGVWHLLMAVVQMA